MSSPHWQGPLVALGVALVAASGCDKETKGRSPQPMPSGATGTAASPTATAVAAGALALGEDTFLEPRVEHAIADSDVRVMLVEASMASVSDERGNDNHILHATVKVRAGSDEATLELEGGKPVPWHGLALEARYDGYQWGNPRLPFRVTRAK